MNVLARQYIIEEKNKKSVIGKWVECAMPPQKSFE